MKMTKLKLLVMAIAAFSLIGGAFLVQSGNAEAKPHISIAQVFEAGNPGNQTGGSWLIRREHSLEMGFGTTELEPAAYTVWWLIFNNPEGCNANGCGEDDVFIDGNPANGPNMESREAAQISAVWATGFVVGEDGVANAGAILVKNSPPGQVLYGPMLQNIQGAEIHLVIRTHSAALPGQIAEQITSVNGACNPTCQPAQVAVHMP